MSRTVRVSIAANSFRPAEAHPTWLAIPTHPACCLKILLNIELSRKNNASPCCNPVRRQIRWVSHPYMIIIKCLSETELRQEAEVRRRGCLRPHLRKQAIRVQWEKLGRPLLRAAEPVPCLCLLVLNVGPCFGETAIGPDLDLAIIAARRKQAGICRAP